MFSTKQAETSYLIFFEQGRLKIKNILAQVQKVLIYFYRPSKKYSSGHQILFKKYLYRFVIVQDPI